MYVMIDNYDSFVYNLVAYINELKREVLILRNDMVDCEELIRLYRNKQLSGIIISPGPKRPNDSGASLEIIDQFEDKVPILGVCLGHQAIAYHYGARIVKGACPMHGKISDVYHDQSELFYGIPSGFQVTRYHSLVVDKAQLPSCLCVNAVADDQEIMAIRHKKYPIYGLQFHPEAVLTEYGHKILENFLYICEGTTT